MRTDYHPWPSGRFRVLRSWIISAAIVFGSASCGPGDPAPEPAPPVFPGAVWTRKIPEEAGYSGELLEELSRHAGGTGCIVHNGEIIYEWGDPTVRNDSVSSTKPFYAYLVFTAIEKGLIKSLDDRVMDWMPEIGELNAELGYKDRGITFHHLLSQTSGYGLEEPPGAAYAYNDFATGLLGFLLYSRVYAVPPGRKNHLLNGPLLGEVIGFEQGLEVARRGSQARRVSISARDLARFGLLYLRGGRWGTVPALRGDLFAVQMGFALPPDLPRASGKEAEVIKEIGSFGGGRDMNNHLGCQGYCWWFNRITPDGVRFLPDAPLGTFLGLGYGGRFALIVIPEHDLVVVWQDIYRWEDWTPLSEVGRFRVNRVLRELLAARIPGDRGCL